MKKLRSIVILLTLFGINRLNAQMTGTSFVISNNQSCNITILYEVSDCINGGNIVCHFSALVMPPHSTHNVPCAGPGNDIYVWLKEMDGVDITNGGSNAYAVGSGGCLTNQMSATAPVPAAAVAAFVASGSSCNSPTGNYSLLASSIFVKIGY